MDWRLKAIDGRWHRLIPSRFPPIDVYERLGPPDLAAAAKDIEALTNPRLRYRDRRSSDGPALGPAALQNWNHAPFAYKNPEGSAFLSSLFGALELMGDLKHALARAVLQRERFLRSTAEPPLHLDMRQLITPVAGSFADLRGGVFEADRDKRWALGEGVRNGGVAGVLFHWPEHPAGEALAVFDPDVLSSSVQGAHYRFVWDGKQVASIYDFSTGQVVTRSEVLQGTVPA